MISDLGPSGDYTSLFFRYKDNKIKFLGKTEGLFDYGIFLHGDGKVFALSRAQILQTWYINKEFYLDNGKLVERPKKSYRVVNYYISFKKYVVVRKSCSLKSGKVVLKYPQVIKFTSTDNKKWCEIQTAENKKYYIFIKITGIFCISKQLLIKFLMDSLIKI